MNKWVLGLLLFSITGFGGVLLKYDDDENLYAPKVLEYVMTDIRDQVAVTEVTVMFSMSEYDTTFAQLQFPLPASANIIRAEEFLDGVWIACSLVAVVDSSDSGIGTGGVSGGADVNEYLGERPFVLELVASTPEDVRVRFKYIQLLEYDKGLINYTYPSHSPDYVSESCDSFSFMCMVHSSRDIVSFDGGYAGTSITGSGLIRSVVHGERDFYETEPLSLDLEVESDDIGLTAMFYKQDPDTGYFLFIVEPPMDYDTSEIIPKDFVFVIDRSGSMRSDNKMINARLAAIACIENLNPMDRFNIIPFNSSLSMFSEEMLPVTEDNRRDGVEYLDELIAGGGTNIYEAVAAGLDCFESERLAEMIFLTDGLSDRLDETREHARAVNLELGASIYSIGLGDDVDSVFLANLAFENSGTYLKVESSNIEEKVTELFSYLNYPVLRTPELMISGIETDEIYPRDIPALFMGKQLVISGKYYGSGDADIALTGIEDGPVEYDFPDVHFPDYTDSLSFIPIIWAKQYIDYWIAWMRANGEQDSLVTRVTDIALRYGIVCKYTEFYHGEEEEEEEDTTGWESVAEVSDIHLNAEATAIGIRLDIALNHPEIVDRVELLRSIDGGAFESIGDIDLALPIYDYPEKGQHVSYIVAIHYYYGVVDYSRTVSLDYLLPGELYVSRAYPNPFNASLNIELSGDTNGRIQIFDINGNPVRTLNADGRSAIWDGRDNAGQSLESGVYFIHSDGDPVKVMLLK